MHKLCQVFPRGPKCCINVTVKQLLECVFNVTSVAKMSQGGTHKPYWIIIIYSQAHMGRNLEKEAINYVFYNCQVKC